MAMNGTKLADSELTFLRVKYLICLKFTPLVMWDRP